MDVIIISGNSPNRLSFTISGSLMFVCILCLCALFYYMYDLGIKHTEREKIIAQQQVFKLNELQLQLKDEKGRLAMMLAKTKSYHKKTVLKLSELQAKTIRLDALGKRLVTMAKLDSNEFDFASTPGQGGPLAVSVLDKKGNKDILSNLNKLGNQLDDREFKLREFEYFDTFNRLKKQIEPEHPPISHGWISSGFGIRNDPINGSRTMHRGIDFSGGFGSNIYSVASGIVVFSGTRGSYGKLVEIDHGKGLVSRYAHNSKILVKKGERVSKGQIISKMGNSGRVTGTHLHFEILKNGKNMNPINFINMQAKN